MQQHQPQPEFGQDHIVRRLLSKFRKPSDASAIGLPASISGGAGTMTSQGAGPSDGLALSAGDLARGAGGGGASGSSTSELDGHSRAPGLPSVAGPPVSSVAARLATNQNRWSQLVASAAAGASKQQATGSTTMTSIKPQAAPAQSTSGPLLEAGGAKSTSDTQHQPRAGSSSAGDSAQTGAGSNRSSSEKELCRTADDEMDENYFRSGGRGHQTILENMEKR